MINYSPVFSRDGMTVIAAVNETGRAAELLETATGVRIGEPMQLDGSFSSASFSADGTIVVTADGTPRVRIWDGTTGAPIRAAFVEQGMPLNTPLEGHNEDPISEVALSTNGRILVTLTETFDKTAVRLWNVETGETIGQPFPGQITQAAFVGDGRAVVTINRSALSVWEVAGLPRESIIFAERTPDMLADAPSRMTRWAKLTTGLELTSDGTFLILDATAWRELLEENGGDSSWSYSINKSGQEVHRVMPIRFECHSCGSNYRVKDDSAGRTFVCRHCGAELYVPDEHAHAVDESFDAFAETRDENPTRERSMAPRTRGRRNSRSGRSHGSGNRTWLWGGVTGGCVIAGLIAFVSIRLSASRQHAVDTDVVDSRGDGSIAPDEVTVTEEVRRDAVGTIVADSTVDSSIVLNEVIAAEEDLITLLDRYPSWMIPDHLPVCYLVIPDKRVAVTVIPILYSLGAFSPDGRMLVTWLLPQSDEQSGLQLRDTATGQAIGRRMRTASDHWFYDVAFSPSSELLLTGSGKQGYKIGEAQMWNARTGEPVGGPLSHEGPVRAVAFSPDGEMFVTGSGSQHADPATGRLRGEAQLWDTATRTRLGPPLEHDGMVNTVMFTPDGDTLLTASCADVVARLWDVQTGQPIGEPLRHETGIMAARLSPDGTIAATSSYDETARLWRTDTSEPIGEVLSHDGPVRIIAFSPNGKCVATGSHDGIVRLWDVETQQQITSPLEHTHTPTSIAFSPDGKTLATADEGGTVQLWRAETGARLEEPRSAQFGGFSVTFHSSGKLLTSQTDHLQVWDVEDQPLNGTGDAD